MKKDIFKIVSFLIVFSGFIYLVEDRYASMKIVTAMAQEIESKSVDSFQDLRKINKIQLEQLRFEFYDNELQMLNQTLCQEDRIKEISKKRDETLKNIRILLEEVE